MLAKLKDFVINRNDSLLECYRKLNASGNHMLVCLDDEKFVGIVTDYDIRQGILSGVKLEEEVNAIINNDPIVVRSDISKEAALALMKQKEIDAVPVVDKNGNFVDVYSMNDLVILMTLPNSAVIMAGGLGKRLMPLTKNTPKPLLKIGEKTIIEHVINNMYQNGIESFFVTINYKSSLIKEHLKDGKHLGVNISYLEENKQLGTIGAVSLLGNHKIEFPFIVMNGDILSRINFRKLLAKHADDGNLLTVCLTNYNYEVPYGVIEVQDGRILGISEKPRYSFFINAGIYCMSPELIDFIPTDEFFDVTMLMNLLLIRKIPIGYFIIDKYWRDIGNPEDYFRANEEYRNGDIK